MPDLSITAVTLGQNILSTTIRIGEAVPAFDIVYLLGAKYFLADATDIAKAKATHITITTGSTDDYVLALSLSGFNLDLTGPTLIVSDQYVLSANPGKIAPRADLLTTNFVTKIFDGVAAGTARFSKDVTGIQVP